TEVTAAQATVYIRVDSRLDEKNRSVTAQEVEAGGVCPEEVVGVKEQVVGFSSAGVRTGERFDGVTCSLRGQRTDFPSSASHARPDAHVRQRSRENAPKAATPSRPPATHFVRQRSFPAHGISCQGFRVRGSSLARPWVRRYLESEF